MFAVMTIVPSAARSSRKKARGVTTRSFRAGFDGCNREECPSQLYVKGPCEHSFYGTTVVMIARSRSELAPRRHHRDGNLLFSVQAVPQFVEAEEKIASLQRALPFRIEQTARM